MVVLIRAGIVQHARDVFTQISMNVYVCVLRGFCVVDVGVRAMTGHGSAQCGLRNL